MNDTMTAHDTAHGMILEELVRAERIHPSWPRDVIHQAAIVGEEAGEVLKAAIDYTYAHTRVPQDQAPALRRRHRQDLITELIQTGAMVHRMLDRMIHEEMK